MEVRKNLGVFVVSSGFLILGIACTPKANNGAGNFSLFGSANDGTSGSVFVPKYTYSFDKVTDYFVQGEFPAKKLGIHLSAPQSEDVVLSYAASPLYSTGYLTTGTVTIPAGQTTASLAFPYPANGTTKTVQVSLRDGTKGGYAGTFDTESVIVQDATLAADYQDVSLGSHHSCAIKGDGSLVCWGSQLNGMVGNNVDLDESALPTVIDSGTAYTQVTAQHDHSCALTSTGVIKCWGSNGFGVLGDNTVVKKLVPTAVHGSIVFSAFSTGYTQSCGIEAGTNLIWCWGNDFPGVPTQVGSDTYTELSVGYDSVCAIGTDQKVYCWGQNGHSQLGSAGPNSPTTPIAADSSNTYLKITVGVHFACGITTAHALRCWGSGEEYDFADGVSADNLSPRTILSGVSFKSLSTALDSHHLVCGVTPAKKVKCWGKGIPHGDGTIPVGAVVPPSTLATNVDISTDYLKIAAGNEGGCGITDPASGPHLLKCWGFGQSLNIVKETTNVALSVLGGENMTSVATGAFYNSNSCGISKNKLKCWGATPYSTATAAIPRYFDLANNYKKVGITLYHACAITATGVLKCWGVNLGQMGLPGFTTTAVYPSPVTVDPGVSYKELSVGGPATCGITVAGKLKCFGAPGIFGPPSSSFPLQVLPTVVDGSETYQQVSVAVASSNACAITTSGVLKCWGENVAGVLGDNTSADHATPQPVFGSSRFTYVSVGGVSVCAVTTTKKLMCFGDYQQHTLGFATSSEQKVPILVDGANNYIDVSIGYFSALGVTESHELKYWGSGLYSDPALGGGSSGAAVDTPTDFDSSTLYQKANAGYGASCGLTTAGVAKCWGSDIGRALGQGRPIIYPNFVTP